MTPQRHKHTYKLAPAQEGMFRHFEANNSGSSVEQIVCSLEEAIEPTTLKSAWRRITERHGALRTSFHFDDGAEPHQCVYAEVALPWKYRDVSGLTAGQQETELNRWLSEDVETAFELDHAPLFRLNLFRLADKKWCLVWTIQRGILDSRSIPIVLTEVFRSYDAERNREALDLPAVPRYPDYLDFLNRLNLAQAEKYWRETLEGFTGKTSLAALEAPAGGQGYGEERIRLSGTVSRALAQIAARERFTVNNAVEAAWAIALSRYNGSTDVVFGSTRTCRNFQPRAASMVGTFVNTVPVRVRIKNELPLLELLSEMRATEIQLRDYEHTPLPLIHSWSEVPSSKPLFESAVEFHHASLDSQMKSPYLNWANRKVHRRESQRFPVTLSVYAEPELELRLAYDRKRFCSSRIDQALRHLESILQDIAAGNQKKAGDFSIQIMREEHHELAIPACSSLDHDFSEPCPLANGLQDQTFTIAAAPDGAISGQYRAIPVPQAYERPIPSAKVLSPVMVESGLVPVTASPLMPQRTIVEAERIAEAYITLPDISEALPEIAGTEVYSADGVPDDAAGELQAVLAEIWCSGLGQTPASVGAVSRKPIANSLKDSAVRLFSSIKDRFESQQHFTTLSAEPEMPSVPPSLTFAPVGEPDHQDERTESHEPGDSAVVAIQPNGAKPPIFCIGALGGESALFPTLAAELGNDQPVYGLDPDEIINDPRELADVKKIARHCIAELRAAGHHQPYCLLGHSFGGLVAFEIAQQLKKNGAEVPALVLIDTHYEAGCRSSETIFERLHRYKHQLKNRGCGAEISMSGGASAHEQRARNRYRARPYSGRACIFKPSSPRAFLHGGFKIGWSKIIRDEISIYFEIPGDNGTINTAKHAPLIARRLREFLGGVQEYRVEQTLSRLAS